MDSGACLFPLERTGVSTVRSCSGKSLWSGSISAARIALHPIDSPNCAVGNWEQFALAARRSWDRHDRQRESALDLLRAESQHSRFETARNVMKLNHLLGEITAWRTSASGTTSRLSESRRRRAVGWQLDGHHLNLNYFVLGDQSL